MPCACCWSVGNHIILKRGSRIQIFLNGDILLNGSWVDLDGTLKWRVERQLLFKERGISEAWRSRQKTMDMWANCVLKHCLSLKTIIPNFVAFLVSLRIAISCVRKMSFWVNSATGVDAGHCFIIHLPGGGQCPLVRDLASQLDCLKYQPHRVCIC